MEGGISLVRFGVPSNALVFLVLALPGLQAFGCGGNVANDAPQPAGTSSGGGAGAVGGASSIAGAAATAAGSTGVSPNTIFSILENSVGRFFVKIQGPDTFSNMPGYMDVSGVLKTAAIPNLYVETPVASENDCTLYQWSVPACPNANNGAGCDGITQICTATDACTPIPTNRDVGDVTVTGVSTTTGATSFALMAVSNTYTVPNETTLVYPGVSEGEAIKVAATGGSVPAFEVSSKGILPLVLGASSYVLAAAEPLTVTWAPPGAASDARIQLIMIVQHYAVRGRIACDVADTGSLTISANFISRLIALGVGGYPRLTVTRRSLGTTTVANGQVVLSVESSVSPEFSINGYASCHGDYDCPTGQTCNANIRLCQ